MTKEGLLMTVTQMYAALDMSQYPAEGLVTAGIMVLAVDTSGVGATKIPETPDASSWAVVQMGAKSVDSSLEPEETTNAYLRQGKSTVKTGNQRTFDIDADRCVGDVFQDWALGHSMKYAVGQACVVPYAYFNVATGAGEVGLASLVVETDGSGNEGDPLGVSISLKKWGPTPVEYTHSVPSSGG
jgi:hypothetical protein